MVGVFPDWVGFSGKTLWDWLQLLIIPVVLAIVGFLLNKAQRGRELQAEHERSQDASIQSYLGQMETLLLDRGLRGSESGSEVRDLARARTLATLAEADRTRKRRVMQFLWESNLIKRERPIISLRGADLREADLTRMQLTDTSLLGANLEAADLSGSAMCILRGSSKTLIEASDKGVDPQSLMKPVAVSTLAMTNLRNAKLKGTDLRGVDLHWSDLSGADLSGARVFDEQLDKCDSLSGATLPNRPQSL